MALGLVGPSARASDVERDIRQDFPTGIFRSARLPIFTWKTGDVYSRAYILWLEIQQSVAFIQNRLTTLPNGPICADSGPLQPDYLAVSLVEGWRGEICHCALTDAQGKFSRYKIVDPSFHNGMGLAMSLREVQISDAYQATDVPRSPKSTPLGFLQAETTFDNYLTPLVDAKP